jgi:hypothetical protein
MKMFASGSKDIDAKVVNNAMVVAFNSGDAPRVWRADMSHMQTATLEVRDAAEKGKFQLVLKSADNDDVVGTFPNKEEAAAALRLMTAAMMEGEKTGGAAAAPKQGNFFVSLLKWVVGAFVTIVFLVILMFLFGPHPGGRSLAVQNYPGLNNGPPPVKQGVPLPADQLFGE